MIKASFGTVNMQWLFTAKRKELLCQHFSTAIPNIAHYQHENLDVSLDAMLD